MPSLCQQTLRLNPKTYWPSGSLLLHMQSQWGGLGLVIAYADCAERRDSRAAALCTALPASSPRRDPSVPHLPQSCQCPPECKVLPFPCATHAQPHGDSCQCSCPRDHVQNQGSRGQKAGTCEISHREGGQAMSKGLSGEQVSVGMPKLPAGRLW